MHRPHPAEAEVADELAAVRPGLLPRYAAELPGARAAVLTRLWRALAHEPLPWIGGREPGREGLTLRLRDGRRLHGPAADPYATAAYVTAVRLGEVSCDHPARLMTELAVPHGEGFAAELGHSVASLALSRAGQEDRPKEWPMRDWEWEQRVVDGHPYHPGCRSRPGFSVAEQLAYGPEHRPVVELGSVPVRAEECLVTGVWPEELRDAGRLLLPVHPWQAKHVLKGAIEAGFTAHPLMSLRTLAVPDGPHVKTALSARLTSSVRDISAYSIGLSATLSAFAESLSARSDGLLHVTRTLGAATAGSPDLAAVLRESPQTYAATERGERVVPVAALSTTELPESPGWLADFTRLTLTVGLRLLELGVALEAHGQNFLVVLSDTGAPLRLVYRDLADIRVSPVRLARHGVPVPELTGRIVTDDVRALRRKLFGSLVAGALAGTAGSAPALGAALETAVRDLPRTPDLVALLKEPLPAKALTLMRMSPGTPGDQWTGLPNPLR
ncbi:IucA/IucC family protein [Streptomyces cylindrosporus]|uniref:IucA/IucC family siderophore biosynthesis protein n=1 Tax=Streptomyces cylindrosporus TaxID=2927583 RepID=A0ABS9Y2B2_9ACTN|nr:IucA/IucC family protein [Streptomyces cylindrosporus]MCI3271342.1 IucA/IucC family siderophore biosynthesis protein [Streptomyces cylindrosporus]